MSERVVTTAFDNKVALMLVERLKNAGIPARVGSETSSTGVFGVELSRTVIVPEEYIAEAKEILEL
ncbi:MAG: DUF2007 domain-containing protein [bacterium]|nr:DUF2007 domain-containing protein [bacterium]